MKTVIVLSAFAVFALGTLVGRASVSSPVEDRIAAQILSLASVTPVSPNQPIENYQAI